MVNTISLIDNSLVAYHLVIQGINNFSKIGSINTSILILLQSKN